MNDVLDELANLQIRVEQLEAENEKLWEAIVKCAKGGMMTADAAETNRKALSLVIKKLQSEGRY